MNAHKGKSRFVLVFPAFGVVIKFPVIRLWRVLRTIITHSTRRRRKALWYLARRWSPESSLAFSGLVFQGIIANLRERALWKRTHNPFLQPTIFCLFGLLNIQRYGKICESHCPDLFWMRIRMIIHEKAYDNYHQFSNPKNYCEVDGKLRILDYGGRGGTRVIVKYGKKIHDEFDLTLHNRDSET